jgi:hypothetical protein
MYIFNMLCKEWLKLDNIYELYLFRCLLVHVISVHCAVYNNKFLQRRKSYWICPAAAQDVYAVYLSILSKVGPSGRREDSARVV